MIGAPLPPLTFHPIFRPTLWGGRRLPGLVRRAAPDQPIGECWLLSDQDPHLSMIASGPLAGQTLRAVVTAMPERILGPGRVAERFPLLIKLIDARERLSLQVHPNDEQARRLEGPAARGKTEAWVILACEPHARIMVGLQPGTTPTALADAIRTRTVASLVQTFEPRPGDAFFIPAGTVHAIGAGVLLFEVQQTSDLTYRLYDWDRIDPLTGRPRDIHWDKAFASINFSAPHPQAFHRPTPASSSGSTRLIDCEYFDLVRHVGDQPFTAGQPNVCSILVGIDGSAAIRQGALELPIERGSTWLLTADTGSVEVRPSGPATILECRVK